MLAQWLTDRLCRRPKRRRQRIGRQLIIWARRVLLDWCRWDPEVKVPFAGRRIEVPLSHPLPLLLVDQPEHNAGLVLTARLVAAKYPDASILDVGANVGDTAILLYQATGQPVMAVEGHTRYYGCLARNTFGLPIVPVRCVVGDENRAAALVMRTDEGTAHVDRGEGCGRAGEWVTEIRTLTRLVHESQFNGAKLLKIDTDGYEAAVLRGAESWLRVQKPVLFIEFDPRCLARYERSDPYDLLDWLYRIGYERCVAYDRHGWFARSLDLSDPGARRELVARARSVYVDLALCAAGDGAIVEKLIHAACCGETGILSREGVMR